VLDDSRDVVWVLNNINEFYAHEAAVSAHLAVRGSLWMKKITDRMLRGGGVTEDPDTLKTIGDISPVVPSVRLAKLAPGRRKVCPEISRRIRRARSKANAAAATA